MKVDLRRRANTKSLYGGDWENVTFEPIYYNNRMMRFAVEFLWKNVAITHWTIGEALDFFLFTGPTPGSVVQQYTEIICRTFMPPS
jgi:alpha-glucosidase (family GH31 glycosyl hydrolase)